MRTIKTLTIALLAAIALSATGSACRATTEPEITTAIRHNDLQRVQTLLSEGVDVNERDESAEQTPLMWAAQTGHLDLARALIRHSAKVNLVDDFGASALKLANDKGYTAIAKLLAQNGAVALRRQNTPTRVIATAHRVPRNDNSKVLYQASHRSDMPGWNQ